MSFRDDERLVSQGRHTTEKRNASRDRMRRQVCADAPLMEGRGIQDRFSITSGAFMPDAADQWWGDGEIERDPEYDKQFEKFGIQSTAPAAEG